MTMPQGISEPVSKGVYRNLKMQQGMIYNYVDSSQGPQAI
jgi:hypothetical protein